MLRNRSTENDEFGIPLALLLCTLSSEGIDPALLAHALGLGAAASALRVVFPLAAAICFFLGYRQHITYHIDGVENTVGAANLSLALCSFQAKQKGGVKD